jgi:DNA primase
VNNNTIEEIKERLDIVDFIRQYVPNLRRAGKTYKACCPFHKEKTPSFTCSSEKGLFYCFGCQEGGDIFAFLMKMEHLSFNEALEKLAALAGVEYRPAQPLTAEENRRAAIRKVMDFTKAYYHKNLLSAAGTNARAYVKKRQLTKETCQQFELGYSKGTGNDLAKQALQTGYTEENLKEAGLCAQTAYGLRDYFRNRLMFPIINQRGDTVGFGGRILDEGEPKYLNSPETVLFTKSHVLYGLNFAGPAIRKTGHAVLLEGYMDVIGCHQAGVNYTVAPLGTSLTEDHARLLKRYTDNVIVLFDPDAAGIKAALRGALILIERGLFVKVASLPEGLDPDEYIIKYGKESFETILEKAQDLIAFHTKLQLEAYKKPLQPQDKTTIISQLVQTLEKQPDEIVRLEWVKYVAEQVGVNEQLVLARLEQVKKSSARIARIKPSSVPPVASPTAEDNLLAWIIKSPQHIVLCADLTENDFSQHAKWEVFQALVKAHAEHPDAAEVTPFAIPYAPASEKEFIRLSLLTVPADFDPARDIAAGAAKLVRAGLQKQMETVKKQMKQYDTGNVPPAVFQQYVQLQNKLKKYRN